MKQVKINLTDVQYKVLENKATDKGMSIQDLIRSEFFSSDTIFSPEEAIRRIQSGVVDGMEIFTLPDVYGDDWTLDRGPAGAFGKAFYNYVTKKEELKIRYVSHGNDGRRAEYRIEK